MTSLNHIIETLKSQYNQYYRYCLQSDWDHTYTHIHNNFLFYDKILMVFYCLISYHRTCHCVCSVYFFVNKNSEWGWCDCWRWRLQISGLAMLVSGIWVQIALHRYMELSTFYTNTFQIILVGTGLLIIFVGTIACCCTVKAQSSLLYLVSYTTFFLLQCWRHV